MDETTRDLTTRIASGDTEAFARFYEAWFDWMFHEARRSTQCDESFALDVVQDAMMRVIRSMKPLEHEPALKAWLRRTVRSCAIDLLRRDARREAREAIAGPAPVRSRVADDSSERLAWLESEIRTLDEPTRTLVLMRHRFGWTLERIGTVLGLKTGAVDGRLRRAVETLGRRAKEAFDER